jgi:hypothetical protein
MNDSSPSTSSKGSTGTRKISYLWALIFALATLPNVFLTGPIAGNDVALVREVTWLGSLLCNPIVGDVQPSSCGEHNAFPNDLLFTAGLGLLYGVMLLAIGYVAVLIRARSRKINLKRLIIKQGLMFLGVIAFLLAVGQICDFGWYCFEPKAPGDALYREGGRVWMLGTFLIAVPGCLPIAWRNV